MSGLHTKPQETPNQVIANLDDLFTEDGITIRANEHLVLRLGEQHNAAPLPPTSASVYALKGQPQLRFEGGEHTEIGDTTLLRFVKDAPAIPAAQVELHLPNGLALSYGQVVALGGDFYGIPDQPISNGATPADRVQRFASAFNSLAVLPASNAEAKQILAVMQKEIAAVNQAIRDGKQPHEAYDALGDTLSEEWNKITGGGSFVSALFPLGRYLKLAANNSDHFAEGALAAYIAGHTAAVEQAVLAKNSGDEKQLEIAYAMNAFADHYLTDLFSAGHLRVPRKQLAAVVTPSDLGSLITRFMHDEDSKFGLNVRNGNGDQWRAYGDKRYFDAIDSANRLQVKRVPRKQLAAVVTPSDLGSLITRFMHDEDSKFGLNVRNGNGDQWRAYGDKRYFDAIDSANRLQVNQAVQLSADEIFAAYLSGVAPLPGNFSALKKLPDLQAVLNPAGNFSPLFKVEGNKVLRRKDVNNLNDTATIDDWWGWSTYLLLKDYTPTGNVA